MNSQPTARPALHDSAGSPWPEPVRHRAAGPRPAWLPSLGVDPRRLVRMLEAIDYGLMLVDAAGRIVYANEAAWRQCGQAPALLIEQGRLQMRRTCGQDELRRALLGAASGRRSLVLLEGSASGVAAASMAVVPVDPIEQATDAATALLIFGRVETSQPLSIEFFARAHRLTGAEQGVLSGLCDGLSPAEVARRGGVAMSTVRTQIGSMRTKTASASIRALVGMVTALPPIAPVIRASRPRAPN